MVNKISPMAVAGAGTFIWSDAVDSVWHILLQGLIFICLHCSWYCACGGRKTSTRTSTIVQFIFYFWSFEISVNSLRNQK